MIATCLAPSVLVSRARAQDATLEHLASVQAARFDGSLAVRALAADSPTQAPVPGAAPNGLSPAPQPKTERSSHVSKAEEGLFVAIDYVEAPAMFAWKTPMIGPLLGLSVGAALLPLTFLVGGVLALAYSLS